MGKFKLNYTEGLDTGVVIPKTNSSLINYGRNDDFFSRLWFYAMAGLNSTYHDLIFVQLEWKGGFINMPDIRSTANGADKA